MECEGQGHWPPSNPYDSLDDEERAEEERDEEERDEEEYRREVLDRKRKRNA